MRLDKNGVTLLEIISALLILAFAFIPLIGVIGTSSSDSDVANSVVFAQTAVRNILDTLLDDVPFYAIKPAAGQVADVDGNNAEDNVAEIVDLASPVFDRKTFLTLLGNDASADSFARGQIIDERGLVYKTKLYVFPIPVSNTVDTDSEIAFTHLPRPIYENQVDANGQNIWYTYDNAFVAGTALSPYDTPDGSKLVQPPLKTLGAVELGAPAGPDGNSHCVMKKILLRVSWQNRSGHDRSIDIFTMKANLQ
ncbi:MAG: hypothetical protein A2W80_11225 [Candidatus Riflebacteria bacterium GWC2_50_8]|nr:MAG: hypothetical protein A2W80_11225 [Candidatus Riflebacteria bacterium GWC2_50_8]